MINRTVKLDFFTSIKSTLLFLGARNERVSFSLILLYFSYTWILTRKERKQICGKSCIHKEKGRTFGRQSMINLPLYAKSHAH
jgi:hypothetical protein